MIKLSLPVTRPEAMPLAHHWSFCVGAGRASEGLRAAWQQQLSEAIAGAGFRYVRFHGLLHDDMFVYREDNGRPVLNFQYIDELFDRLLDLGIRPFVEFGFCPGDLAREKETVFWWKGHGSPPLDLGKWAGLIRALLRHWITRYGADEVRRWYFEVWNEPNLGPFFRGTKSEYFALYAATARAVKEVDPALRVGGPATSNFVPDARFDGETENTAEHAGTLHAPDLDALNWKPVWLADFLAFCVREKLPLDFVSCHPYPTDWALDSHGQGRRLTRGVDATPRDLALLHRLVREGPYPSAEIHLTEWNSSSSSRDFSHDYLPAATYVVRTNIASIGTADSLAYWTFTDIFEEERAGDTAFHGGFGMLNFQGLAKPVFHAYRFLHGLGDELLGRTERTVITHCRADGKISALAWHYPPEIKLSVPASFDTRQKAEETLATGEPEILEIRLEGLAPGAACEIEVLDREHGNVMAAWDALGRPEPPDRQQTHAMRRAAFDTFRVLCRAGADGVLSERLTLTPWAIASVREL